MNGTLLQAADAAIGRGDWAGASALLRRLYRESPGLAAAQAVVDRSRRIPSGHRRCRLFVARSFTIEPVVSLLRAAAWLEGLDLEVEVGDFGTYAQDLLDPGSRLYAAQPDVVLLAVQIDDALPSLSNRFAEVDPSEARKDVDRFLADLEALVAAFRERSLAHLVIQGFELPAWPAAGVLDAQSTDGQAELVRDLNRRLVALSRRHSGVVVVDYDGLVARQGRERWRDARRWLSVRMPVAAERLPSLADEYLRVLLPLAGKVAKALVVDLDDTLWGGVLGEDGPGGIRLGAEYPGAAYLDVQRALLALHGRGVILAVASKNDHDEAYQVLESHPAMVLRPRHFASVRINWNDKAESLREIARELNIGLDAVAFLDDNPVERELVRTALPQVSVIELGDDPTAFAAAVLRSPIFERVTLSGEDRQRARMYAEQRERDRLQQAARSLEDFWRSLEMEMDMSEAAAQDMVRVAQLTQKTNQFNLTTRRYSVQEIEALAAAPDTRVYRVRLRDRFGDNGTIGVAITRDSGSVCEIDTMLLSCRVIGRTVESAMLARIAGDARARGCQVLRGTFVPTARNGPAGGTYAAHRFTRVLETAEASTWERDLRRDHLEAPDWIRMQVELHAGQGSAR